MSGVIGPVKRATASRLGKAGIVIPVGTLDSPIEAPLKRRVTGGFIVAVLLTIFMGLSSWRSTRLSANDSDWVVHTYAVMETLKVTRQHVVEMETSARTFALVGQDPLLAHYEAARDAVAQDEDELRRLTADNPNQQRRLDVLEPQVRAALEFAASMVAKRQQTNAVAGAGEILETESLMSAVRTTTQEMQDEETRLLNQRSQRTEAQRRLTSFIMVFGVLVGAGLLTAARFAVNREIDVSARGRAQLSALNAELEQRVDQRTAALGESEGRLAGVIQSAMDSILTVDEQQSILLFNAAAERMFRCPAAEALGQPLTRFIPQRFHAAHAGHIHKFANTGVTNRAMGPKDVLWALRADGQEFQIEASISQVVTGGKKLFTVILRDVTERVQAEAVREHLAAVVDSSDDAIISKDLNGTINAWNRGAEKVFGYPASEALGKPMLMLIPPERVNEESDILARIRRGESVEHFETVRVRKDGKKIDVSATISPIRNSSGAIVGASKIARDTSERKRIEAALFESQERFRLLLDGVKDYAIYMLDSEGNVISWNEGAVRIKGYRSEEILGKHFSCFYTAQAIEAGKPARELQESVSKGRFEEEAWRVRKDGSTFWASVVITPMYDDRGSLRGFCKVARDITERKRTEDALREQAQVLDSAQVFVRDMESRVVFWPRGAEKIYGFTPQEALGILSHDLFHTQFPEPLEVVEKKLFETGMWEGELIHTRRDGRVIVVSSAWVLHRNSQGQPIRILETNIDITERKSAEQQLAGQAEELSRQSEELLRSQQALETQSLMLQSVLDSMAEGLVAADEQGKFIIWNPAAVKILGLQAANVSSGEWSAHYGLYLEDMVTPFPADQLPLVRAIRGEASSAQMFVRNPELDEGTWIEVGGGPLKDKNGAVRGGVVAFRDISQRRADEQVIRKLNEELEERVIQRTAQLEASNKELEAFTYSVSHDLRAPLRHISGFSKMLTEEYGPTLPAEAQHHLQRIQEGTRRMGLLVDDLLNLGRIGRHELRLQAAGLESVAGEVIAELKAECEGRKVEWRMDSLPFVECDPGLMRQVFQNLLSNALKFTRPRPQAVIEVGQKDHEGSPAVFVRDNGVGFSMKYADKLFGVFQRLHRAEDFEGTGVGLATVQRIIQKHGGRIWAESALDKGATFYFTLGAPEKEELKTKAASIGDQR